MRRRAGPNPCPPVVVGVGIGGGFDRSAELAKRALLRPAGSPNPDPFYAEMEQELLERINALGTTVLVVTHEKDLVNRFDKRVVMLERGRVVSDGKGYYGRKAQ